MEISIYKRDQSHFALMKGDGGGWGTGLPCLPLSHPRTFSEASGSTWNSLSKAAIGASLVAEKVKTMATHSSILAWGTLWTKELGRLQSMGSQRVRHDWAVNTFTLFTFKAIITSESHFQQLLGSWPCSQVQMSTASCYLTCTRWHLALIFQESWLVHVDVFTLALC